MPFETVGFTEALLQLCFTYEFFHKPVDLRAIWREIVVYHKAGGKFQWYLLCEYDPGKPSSEFLEDIDCLIFSRCLQPSSDGYITLTSLGYCLAFARCLPESLQNLENRTVEVAQERAKYFEGGAQCRK